MIICITGMPGSGKSTALALLEKMGFKTVDSSSSIPPMMRAGGIPVTPESIERFAVRMQREKGKDVFFRIAARKLIGYRGDAVIAGARSIEELDAARRILDARIPLVVLTAPEELRYTRLSRRGRLRTNSRRIFLFREKNNLRQGLGELIKNADFVVSNSGSRADLRKALKELVDALRSRDYPE